MQDDCGGAITELRVDGGAASNDLLMQMQADALGVPVVRPAVTETTALGRPIWRAWRSGSGVGWTKSHRCGPSIAASNRRRRTTSARNAF